MGFRSLWWACLPGWTGRRQKRVPEQQRSSKRFAAYTAIPIVSEDERLTSHEAEARLATRERDWRKRKLKLDAAAAAVFLQDFLDRR